jgi:hypothetical protein
MTKADLGPIAGRTDGTARKDQARTLLKDIVIPGGFTTSTDRIFESLIASRETGSPIIGVSRAALESDFQLGRLRQLIDVREGLDAVGSAMGSTGTDARWSARASESPDSSPGVHLNLVYDQTPVIHRRRVVADGYYFERRRMGVALSRTPEGELLEISSDHHQPQEQSERVIRQRLLILLDPADTSRYTFIGEYNEVPLPKSGQPSSIFGYFEGVVSANDTGEHEEDTVEVLQEQAYRFPKLREKLSFID